MTSVSSASPWTVDQFLEWEAQQDERFEYLDGVIVCMVGAAIRHQRIVRNATRLLERGLAGAPCEVFSETVKLRSETLVAYPDVPVVCQRVDADAVILDDAHLILEVLAPATASFDLGRKWAGYQQLPSLGGYVLVWQDRRAAQVYERARRGWRMTALEAAGEVRLPLHEVAFPLEALYQGL